MFDRRSGSRLFYFFCCSRAWISFLFSSILSRMSPAIMWSFRQLSIPVKTMMTSSFSWKKSSTPGRAVSLRSIHSRLNAPIMLLSCLSLSVLFMLSLFSPETRVTFLSPS